MLHLSSAAAMVEVPAVALRFVRAAPSAITLDFVLATKEEAPKVERYELQYAVPNGVANDMADEAPTSAGKSVRSRDLDLDWM